MKIIILLTSLIFTSVALCASWQEGGMNDPSYFHLQTQKLSKLPLEGRINNIPMTSAHWLHKNGGIAWRYQKNSIQKDLLTKEEALNGADTSFLSPAEKYDLARGDYSFSLTHQEEISQKNYKYEWEGHCHGWVSASLKYSLPKQEVIFVNKDGVTIIFYPQDIMAILSYFEGVKQTPWDYWVIEHKLPWHLQNAKYSQDSEDIWELINSIQNQVLKNAVSSDFKNSESKHVFEQLLLKKVKNYSFTFKTPYVGVKNFKDEEELNDLNAGAVHLVLANTLGLKKQGLVADTDILSPVWNRPISGFQSSIIKKERVLPSSLNKVALRVQFDTKLFYMKEISRPDIVSPQDLPSSINLKYTLELDTKGSIIGGTWEKNSDKVDFLWSPYFSNLGSSDIYFDSKIISELLKSNQ